MGALELLAGELDVSVEQLRDRLMTPGPDQAQPLFTQIQPDGTVIPVFAGGVLIDGVNTTNPAPIPPTPQTPHAVAWQRPSDGAVLGDVEGSYSSGSPGHATQSSDLSILARELTNPANHAALYLESIPWQNPKRSVDVEVTSDDGLTQQFARILRGDGSSDFLRLATTAARKLAFGRGDVNFPGSADGTVTVAHGLGATPVLALADVDPTGAGGGVTSFAIGVHVDATNLTINAHSQNGAAIGPGTLAGWWLAIA